MKLEQLQEAGYAGNHPIVIEIKTAIAFNEPVDVEMDSQQAVAAIKGIVKAFGEPQPDEEGLEWMNTMMRWDLPDGNRLQVIVQGNRTVIEMFSFGESKNKKRKSTPLLQRMRRRQTR